MNRINRLLAEKESGILSIYFTAGYPALEDTIPIARALEKNGVDMLEIGIPFSDPLADGPIIQRSSHIALQNGMSIKYLFYQLQSLRKHIHIPVILMGYLNPIEHYGMEKFLADASRIGIDGLIIPDLPFEEFEMHYADLFEKYRIKNCFFLTPQTSEERAHQIDDASETFIYAVSSLATTGGAALQTHTLIPYLDRLNNFRLSHPILVGFGIANGEAFEMVSQYAAGAIIGSAFIKALQTSGDLEKNISQFIRQFKNIPVAESI